MKVFYDHMIFARQQYGGISKYFCELIKRIPRENWYLSSLISNNQYLEEFGHNQLKFFPKSKFKGKERILAELGFPYSIYKLRTTKWDVFHPTLHPDMYTHYIPKNKPMVITAHDVLYYLFHSTNSKREMIIDIDIKSCQRANKIIAISENTKNDYIQYFGADEKIIEVIHHGINKTKQIIYSQRIEEQPYILYVGLRSDYKNFTRFIQAFSIISKKYNYLKLICTGYPFSSSELKELYTLGLVDKTKVILATEQEMAQLYHDAEMFVFPSLYEGFGMPILEAMVYDCPVVLSNASCFPEIAQNAGLYFNPFDIEDIANKIENILLNDEVKQRITDSGKERLTHFSWEKCAKEHLNVYESVI